MKSRVVDPTTLIRYEIALRLHVLPVFGKRQQIKLLAGQFVFALPKNDTEREVPMSEGAALVLRKHISTFKPRPYTLPWEKPDVHL
jgi:hypothetical protein